MSKTQCWLQSQYLLDLLSVGFDFIVGFIGNMKYTDHQSDPLTYTV